VRTIVEIRVLAEGLAAAEKRVGKLVNEVAEGVAEAKRLHESWEQAQARTRSHIVPTHGIRVGLSAEQVAAADAHHAWREAEHALDRLRRDLRVAEADLARLEPERHEVEVLRQAEAEADLAFADRKRVLDEEIAATQAVVHNGGDAAAVAAAIAQVRELNGRLAVLAEDRAEFVALRREAAIEEAATDALAVVEGEVRPSVGADPSYRDRALRGRNRENLEQRFGVDVGGRAFDLLQQRINAGAYRPEPVCAGRK
jgi:DNA repair exonuclease SbcCD ATPase subunit